MVLYVEVPGHGEIPKFLDELEFQDYETEMTIAGRRTEVPVGAKFGVERCQTGVDEKGGAILQSDLGGRSAPRTAYGSPVSYGTLKPVPDEMTVPDIVSKPTMVTRRYGAVSRKPTYVRRTYGSGGGVRYGVIGVLILAIILVAIISAAIYAVLSKAQEMRDPKKETYVDADGCKHTRFIGGGGLFGSGNVTDYNECNGEVNTVHEGAGLGGAVTGVLWAGVAVSVATVGGYFAIKTLGKKKRHDDDGVLSKLKGKLKK